MPDAQLHGKRAIVTGGSRGIGKAIARALAREGVGVVISARDRVRLDATAAELSAETGRTVIGIVADTTSDQAVDALVAETVRVLGGIDILVNNAAAPGGLSTATRVAQIDSALALEDLNIKVIGYLRTARAVAPHLIAQRWGRIINVTAVHPGATRTERTDATAERNAAAGNSIGRMVDASEVAAVVVFPASPPSVAITGDAIAVGGGSPGTIHY